MGYETRLIIGEDYQWQPEGKPRTVGVIATVDLAKAGSSTRTGKLLAASRAAAERFYSVQIEAPDQHAGSDDFDATLSEDPYGDKLTAVPLAALLNAMIDDNREDRYRRFALACAILAQFLTPDWQTMGDHIVVLQYGH